jgi:hypothetical protein
LLRDEWLGSSPFAIDVYSLVCVIANLMVTKLVPAVAVIRVPISKKGVVLLPFFVKKKDARSSVFKTYVVFLYSPLSMDDADDISLSSDIFKYKI